MQFSLDEDEFGRLVCLISDGPTRATVTAANAIEAARELSAAIQSALSAGTGEGFWEESGGQYRWLFRRENDRLRIVILWSIGTLTGWENKFWVECEAAPFARLVGEELRRRGFDASGLPGEAPPVAVSAAALRLHLAYSAWASRRLLEAASRLTEAERTRDFATADKSVLGTLLHLFAADRIWLRRLRGESASSFLNEDERRWDLLEAEWPPLWQAWQDWAFSVQDDGARRPVRYFDLQGNPSEQPVWQIVLHVVNHATHHRGQVAGFLRAMGHRPPPLDLIRYYRELGS